MASRGSIATRVVGLTLLGITGHDCFILRSYTIGPCFILILNASDHHSCFSQPLEANISPIMLIFFFSSDQCVGFLH